MIRHRKRGKYTPQREQAVQEQQQADQIRATVERVEHFNYLKAKFGPRTLAKHEKEISTMSINDTTPALKPFTIVRKPVGVNCSGQGPHITSSIWPAKGATPMCRGVMGRITLSRLEEGLGHEGFACDKCGRRVKYVPARAP